MECPRCNSSVDHAVNFCPECGLDIDSLSDVDTGQAQPQNNDQTSMTANDTSGTPPGSKDNLDDSGTASHRRDDTNTQEEPSSAPNRSSNPTTTTDSGGSNRPRGDTDEQAAAPSPNTGPLDAAERSHENDRSSERTSPSPDEATQRSTSNEHAHNQDQQDTRPPSQAAEPHPSNAGRQAPSGQQSNTPRPAGTANERTSGQQQGQQSTSRWGGEDAGAPTGTPQGNQPTGSAFSWPTVTATIYGAVAFAVSFGLTYALHTIELATKENGFSATSDSQFAPEWLGSVEQFEVVGWLFYSAHTVPIELTMRDETETINVLEGVYAVLAAVKSDVSTTQLQEISALMFFGSYDATLNALGIESGSEAATLLIPKLAYYVVPGIVALAAGYYLVGRISTGRQLTDGQAAISGALVGIAYAAIGVIAAATVFTFTGDGGMMQSIQPQMDAAALLPLVAYPAGAAAVGGFLAR